MTAYDYISMILDSSRNLKEKAILFIINPFVAFLYSMQDVKTRSSYIVFFMFCVLFGWMFIAETEHLDSYRMKLMFLQFTAAPDLAIIRVLKDYFTPDSLEKDVYRYLLCWLAAKMGGSNYHYFFMLAAIGFSYFYLKSMWFVTQNRHFQQNVYMLILLLIFTFSNSIFNINGLRFYTAAWIGVYALFKLVVDHNYLYFLLMAVLPLVHGAMPVLWVIFVVCWLLRKHIRIILPLLFLSFFISAISLQAVEIVQPFMPAYVQQMIWAYTQSAMAENMMEGSSEPLYARILFFLPSLFYLAMNIIIIKERKAIILNSGNEILGFCLALYTLTNFLTAIPSAGRLTILVIPFLVYLWVDNYEVLKKYDRFLLLYPIMCLYVFFRFFRDNLFEVTDSIFYFAPLPYQLFVNL